MRTSLRTVAATIVLLASIGMSTGAEARHAVLPPSLTDPGSAPSAAAVEMPAVDLRPYRAEDAVRDRLGVGPVRFAIPLDTSFGVSAGAWRELADGRWAWLLPIHSRGAVSLNVALRNVNLPDGAVLWFHDGRGDVVQGPFTSKDLTPNGELWTPVVLGDRAVIEVVMPAEARSLFDLTVFKVNHGYRMVGAIRTKSGSCNVDVVCPEGDPWRDQIRSVGWYSLEGWGTCSGYLVSNVRQDRTPYFLTADHCGVRSNNAQTMVFYWNFESPTCGEHGGGSLEDNQSGAIFRSTWSTSDTTLVELEERPDPDFNLYLEGFDATGDTPEDGAVTIHHPNLDEKSISIDEDALVTQRDPDPTWPRGLYWRLQWDVGTTEPGSSGSLLLNRTNGLAIGVLTGGEASCLNLQGYDYYGMLSEGWVGGGTADTSVGSWLDPDDTGTLRLDGMEADAGGPTTTYWLPVVAALSGRTGSLWRTDVALLNLSAQTAYVTLTLHLAEGVVSIQRTVPASGQTVVEDIVAAAGGAGKGPLEVTSSQSLALTARLYNLASNGTFGQFFRGTAEGGGFGSGEQVMLPQLRQETDLYRTNIAVANSGTDPATVRVTLFDASGTQLVQYLLQIPTASLVQDLEPFSERANRPDLGWGFARVEVTAGSGLLISGSVVDSRTNDATTVEAIE